MKENYIWYEKYRPRALKDMTLDPVNMKTFRRYIQAGDIPHLMFMGSPGSGKTCISEILIKELNASVLRLNAASSGGIDMIRDKVTKFAKAANRKTKIVFLDEVSSDMAKGLSSEAQGALLDLMERTSKNCKFILACNNADRLLPALKSRCTKFSFEQFDKTRLLQLVGRILIQEKYKAPKAGVEKIIDAFYPDIRSCINELQLACSGTKFSLQGIKALAIDKPKLMRNIKAGKLFDIRTALMNIYDYSWVYKFLVDEYLPTLETDKQKAQVVQSIAYWMNKSTTTPIQDINFTGCLCDIYESVGITPRF